MLVLGDDCDLFGVRINLKRLPSLVAMYGFPFSSTSVGQQHTNMRRWRESRAVAGLLVCSVLSWRSSALGAMLLSRICSLFASESGDASPELAICVFVCVPVYVCIRRVQTMMSSHAVLRV